ncbi:MAG: ISNCY family transposase, partial [Pseudomonadota bacterium]
MDAVERVGKGLLTVAEAAQILGISERQLFNVRMRVAAEGAQGVIHGLTGRPPVNRLAEEVYERIVELALGKYRGFNDTHFSEKLATEGIKASRSTVQRVLRQAGVEAVRRRRPTKHRRRRDRKPQEGLMLLWDGSRHDWLEGRGPLLCLMGAVDDATGKLLPGAHFVEQECAAGYLRVLLAITQELGLPWAVYMDQHGALKRNDDYWSLEEELRGEQDPTQVGRALKALDIERIYALSPQAKGRVERMWGTLQDRLVSELRLVNARTLEEANAVLEKYRAEFNECFAVAPRDATPAWRPVRGLDLERVCSFEYEATVGNDNAVRLSGTVIDIPPGPNRRGYAKARVEVRQFLDGSWRVYLGNELLARAGPTTPGELRAGKRRKRSAASRAFRRGVKAWETRPEVAKRGTGSSPR